MIELTEEMRSAFREAATGLCTCRICLGRRLTAVLAVVERERSKVDIRNLAQPTDEMRAVAAVALFPWARDGARSEGLQKALTAVLAVAERQWQEAYGDAYQRGWWHGQHQLCPRCGVELAREVAAERGRPHPAPLDVFAPTVDPCTGCGCAKELHGERGCTGDFTRCPCETWMPLEAAPGDTDG